MRNYIYIGMCALLSVVFAACQDDLEQKSVENGRYAKLSLTIDVPSAEKLVNSRGIYDYESEVKELALIMFEQNGRKEFFNLTGKLAHKAYTEGSTEVSSLTQTGGRKYTLLEDIEGDELSGTYTVYAIANWSSPFCGLTTEELEGMTMNDLENIIISNENFVTGLEGDERLPMTCKVEGVNIEPTSEDATATNSNDLSLSLRRITSHIIFKFQNGPETTGYGQPNFVPTSYTIYNIPKNANLICKGNAQEGLNKLTSQNSYDYNNSGIISVSGSELEFFMLENVQDSKTLTSYNERDKWTAMEDNSKNFLNAPEYSTYIVVSGTYDDAKYMGTTSYVIHLGNFGSNDYSNSKAGFGNFTVNRNEKHTYTVTVNGVNSIITEAENDQENGGEQPGAEGTITNKVKGTSFILDSHYETIMLKFPLDDRCLESNIIVRTPFNEMTYYELFKEGGKANYQDADYKWVHFMAPTSESTFPNYTTDAAVDIVNLAEELSIARTNNYSVTNVPDDVHYMLKNETDDKGITTTYVYVAAFVDEYFYEGKPWPDFVNKEDRIIILNPEMDYSLDKNSIFYPDYIFQITQRSIKTVYADDSDVNGFGIETWNETGKTSFGTPVSNNSDEDKNVHGYSNMVSLIGTNWNIDKTVTGYIKAPSDNKRESHVFDNEVVYYGYNACLSRNRDENGNGTIDEGELKWYLPALEQYTSIWLARDRLHEDTRLFTADDMNKLSNDKNDDYHWSKVNLWTSSPDGARVYWPAEGASYGEDKGVAAGVRCVRSLKSSSDKTASLTKISEDDENIILVTGASQSSMRSTSMSGEYTSGHTERQNDNRLYKAFEVAEDNLVASNNVEVGEYHVATSSPGKEPWVRVKVDKGDGTTPYEFAIKVNDNAGNITFHTINYTNWQLVSQLTDVTSNDTQNTITCKYNNFSITIHKGNTSYTIDNNGHYIVTVYVLQEEGCTYYFQGNSEAMGQGTKSKFSIDEIKNNTLCATYYSQASDKSDLGQWRVPNQRELMLMAQYGYLSDASAGDSKKVYGSSTFFSKGTDLGKIYPFAYQGFVTLDPADANFVIRCVRDAASTTTGGGTVNSFSGESESGYGTGGTLFE